MILSDFLVHAGFSVQETLLLHCILDGLALFPALVFLNKVAGGGQYLGLGQVFYECWALVLLV
jgi:hypothetical protein